MSLRVLLLCGVCVTATAQEPPRIVSIEFEGNRVTLPRVMLREVTVQTGDLADPVEIERSRQAVQDLGLFRSVEAVQQPLGDGVAVIFSVREKYYLVPFPRVDLKDSGEYAYGAQLRWANVGGRNHSLRLIAEQRDRKQQDIGRSTLFSASYFIPQFADSRYNLGLSAGYSTQPVDEADRPTYREDFHSVQANVSRSLSEGSPNQGWSAGLGLLWQNQDTAGADAPPEYGMATAPVVSLGYRDLHFDRFSDYGTRFGASVDVATPDLASDYDRVAYSANFLRLRRVGTRAHQTLHLFAEFGAQHGGPPGNDRFRLGGSSSLRGYTNEFVEGDAYYRVAVEFLRPVGLDWLRALAVFEAGNAFSQPGDASLRRVYSSLGLGLRARVDWFVDLEFDLGYAMPVGDGNEDGRVFFGRP